MLVGLSSWYLSKLVLNQSLQCLSLILFAKSAQDCLSASGDKLDLLFSCENKVYNAREVNCAIALIFSLLSDNGLEPLFRRYCGDVYSLTLNWVCDLLLLFDCNYV